MPRKHSPHHSTNSDLNVAAETKTSPFDVFLAFYHLAFLFLAAVAHLLQDVTRCAFRDVFLHTLAVVSDYLTYCGLPVS